MLIAFDLTLNIDIPLCNNSVRSLCYNKALEYEKLRSDDEIARSYYRTPVGSYLRSK